MLGSDVVSAQSAPRCDPTLSIVIQCHPVIQCYALLSKLISYTNRIESAPRSDCIKKSDSSYPQDVLRGLGVGELRSRRQFLIVFVLFLSLTVLPGQIDLHPA